jgi:hypothetical protein
MQTVAETATFIADCADVGVTESELMALVLRISADPLAGDLVKGSGGLRKVRFAGRGKGKSGGYRALTLFLGSAAPVYLLAVLSKGERATFTPAEVQELARMAEAISATWERKKP